MKDFIGYKAFQVGKLILHMGYLHGPHELVLEVLFNGQFNIFHIAGNPIGLVTFSTV